MSGIDAKSLNQVLGTGSYMRAISIGVRLLDSILDAVRTSPTMTYYHHYRTVNTQLDLLALQAAKLLEIEGYSALPIPASQTIDTGNHLALYQHKTVARLAGLGYIGRSALLVSYKFGPRVRFVSVLTEAPLSSNHNTSLLEFDLGCKDCHVCADMCPAGAISGEDWSLNIERSAIFDAHKCSNYMRQHFSGIGRGAVCGICVSCCPRGRC